MLWCILCWISGIKPLFLIYFLRNLFENLISDINFLKIFEILNNSRLSAEYDPAGSPQLLLTTQH